MKNIILKSVLPLAMSATLASYSAVASNKGGSSSSSGSSSNSRVIPNYGGSSSSSYKYNAPTYSGSSSSSKSSSSSYSSSKPSTPNYSGSSSSSSSSRPNYGSSSSSSSYSKPSYSYGSGSSSSSKSSSSSSSSYSSPKPSTPNYGGSSSSSSSSRPNYGSSSNSYSKPSYSYGSGSSSSSSSRPAPSVIPSVPKTPNYGGSSSSNSSSKPSYSQPKNNDYTYTRPNTTPSRPSPTAPVPSKNNPSQSNKVEPRPNYGQSSSTPNYKYNDYTYNRPKYETGKPIQNNKGNNNGYNNGNGYNGNNSGNYNRPPQTNKNGTVLLKELGPGQSRVRADGTTDKVHKDGKGYTHTFVDSNGSTRKESIRYDRTGKEVKISDTERRRNGDVVTKYKSGVSEVRTRDGLRYQTDRYGKTVYQEKYSSWNNRPVIYREYNNHYTTVYVQNNYYGYPTYFYRPSYYDYNYYSYTLTPWRDPYYYSWHWTYNPWYTSYYRPYPVYYSPAYWLTDYLIMSLIQSNYERIAADREVLEVQSQYNNQVALSETVKDEIRTQVEQSLREQQAAVQTNSTMDPARILKQGRLMVVHSDLNVEDENGSQCQLDEGDILRIINQPSSESPIAELKVVSAKGTSCPAGTTLSLSAQNLIDMENEFQSRIQQGMTEMKDKKVGTTTP